MSKLTPEKRAAVMRRLSEVTARLDEMQPTLSSTVAPEWVELYQERKTLEKQLEDDSGSAQR
jgi:hypothetical protein